eukprot:TRINITY_DN20357_c0_g1::TRINITY_DN20357_c0_g1_i1::g.8499::m.8499 TRINITY_DN20357_c0_g1::TRINITY_DN20357_c0_g1_i1::g.8499  ORF type:complete len:137 (+),score=17.53,sp/O22922/RU2B1_ARATH/63.92/7e-43,RRM_5/PF13893.1/3.5e-12,RRM_1/PF00076.17/9.5e-11,RRM_6/PF14259.1/1.9e-05 TRINITY_DN20357_c0_g1_i1:38-448(+)
MATRVSKGPLRPNDLTPSQTIYINNLNDKIKKEDLRRQLYFLFSQFGAILDVVALKTPKMRGQAFIVFQDISTAAAALRQMQGFPFYDKPMRIQFSRSKSDTVAKMDGTYEKNKGKKAASTAAAPSTDSAEKKSDH